MNICVLSAKQADAFTKFHQLQSAPLELPAAPGGKRSFWVRSVAATGSVARSTASPSGRGFIPAVTNSSAQRHTASAVSSAEAFRAPREQSVLPLPVFIEMKDAPPAASLQPAQEPVVSETAMLTLPAHRGQALRVDGAWHTLPAQQALLFRLEAERKAELARLQALFACSSRTHTHVSKSEAEILLAAHPLLVTRISPLDGRRRLRVPSSDIARIIRAGEHPVCVLKSEHLPDFNAGTLDCSQHPHLTHAEADERLCTCCSPAALAERDREFANYVRAIERGQSVDLARHSSLVTRHCLSQMRPGSPYGANNYSRLSPRHILLVGDYKLAKTGNAQPSKIERELAYCSFCEMDFAVSSVSALRTTAREGKLLQRVCPNCHSPLNPAGPKDEIFPVPGQPTLQRVRI